jgi:branched-chain amino acid transport system substrate-binding protein
LGITGGQDEDDISIRSKKSQINFLKRGTIMNKKLSLLLMLIFLAGLLSGCGPAAKGQSSKEIKVGLDYELSGDVATYGQDLVTGIELAVEEINNNGGVLGKKISLVKADNKSDNAEAANVASKLVTKDRAVAILGPATSGHTKAAVPVAMQNKVPLITASATADDVTVDKNGKVRDYIFKTCFSDSFQGVIMAKFAYEDLGSRKAAVLIDSTSDYSKGLAGNFKQTFVQSGGTIVTEQAYQAKDKNFKAVLTNIKAAGSDVLFLPGYYEEVGLIVKQARELGLDVPVLGGDGYDSPKLADIAGSDKLNGVYFTNHYSSQDASPEVVKFNNAFKQKYSKEPNGFNALGYDLAYFLADALTRAGEADSEKLKDALASTKEFAGVTGKLSVDANHNPVKAITIIQMKDGEQTFFKKQQP